MRYFAHGMLGREYGLQSVRYYSCVPLYGRGGWGSRCSQLKDFGQDEGKIKGAEWARSPDQTESVGSVASSVRILTLLLTGCAAFGK